MRFLLATLVLFMFYSNAYSYCIFGKGKDCVTKNKNKGNQVNIYNNQPNGYGPPYAAAGNQDGAQLRKILAGDKSKNQGYADYKKHFVYYGYDFYAVPHQDGYYKSAETDNRSIAYEYAFNPYISFKAQRTELYFQGLVGSSQMKHEHLFGLINLRLYILNDFVIRTGIGIGRSKIDAVSEEERFNHSTEGSTEVVQFSANYLFGDENTFVGISTTTIQGSTGDSNLGVSSYTMNAGMGF
jgi:hypothetical protein